MWKTKENCHCKIGVLKSKAKQASLREVTAEGFHNEEEEVEIGVVPSAGSGRLQSSATTVKQWLEVRYGGEDAPFLERRTQGAP